MGIDPPFPGPTSQSMTNVGEAVSYERKNEIDLGIKSALGLDTMMEIGAVLGSWFLVLCSLFFGGWTPSSCIDPSR